MLLTVAVAVFAAGSTLTDSTVVSKFSISATCSLIACSQALWPPSRRTTGSARSSLQIFLYSLAVASDCRFATVWATSCSSPLKLPLEAVLPQAARVSTGAHSNSRRARLKETGGDMDGMGAYDTRVEWWPAGPTPARRG